MIDMAFFTAHGTDPAEYCARMVGVADVYVGLIGLRYGSSVRGHEGLSFTELEFETATRHGLPRLVFLLAEESAPISRQAAFRRRLQRMGLTTAEVSAPAELETRLYQALVELALDHAPRRRPRRSAGRSRRRRASMLPARGGTR